MAEQHVLKSSLGKRIARIAHQMALRGATLPEVKRFIPTKRDFQENDHG
jgi:hypothetical protein